jgi:hypothetical protein
MTDYIHGMATLTSLAQDFILRNLVSEVVRIREELNSAKGYINGREPAEYNLMSIDDKLAAENGPLTDWEALEYERAVLPVASEEEEEESWGDQCPGIDPVSIYLGED